MKYKHGDMVRVADDLGDTMSHFESGVDAIILGSYQDLCGGSMKHHHREYSIYIRGKGSVSWYKEDQLELIERGCGDVLVQWREDTPALKAEAYTKYQDKLIKDFVAHLLEELAHEDSNTRVVP